MQIPKEIPSREKKYLSDLVEILTSNFKEKIIGIYLFGSASYGGYIPIKSDLDVQMITKEVLSIADRRKIAALISHSALPCPARKLEFVSYPQSALHPVSRSPEFDINFNTGENQFEHIGLDFSKEPSHWFLLDIAIGRELGYNLIGPKPVQAFGKIPKSWVLSAMLDCLSWYEENEPVSFDLILNTCRCWKFLETDKMCSKLEGLKWASQRNSSLKYLEKEHNSFKEKQSIDCNNYKDFILSVKNSLQKALSD